MRKDDAFVISGLAALVVGTIGLFLNRPLTFAYMISIFMASWMMLGMLRHGRLGKYFWVIIGILLVWCAGFAGMYLLPYDVAPEEFVGGFPPATAVMIYAVWLIPFFVATLPYALFYKKYVLSDEDLKKIEELKERIR